MSEPVLRGNEWAYVKQCLDTGWVSSVGPFVDRFEREVAAYVGAAHAVATMNGTAALHIALRTMGVTSDDEVLVSSLTFIAPVNAIRYCGAHPIFVDADPGSWQMDVDKVSRFLSQECEVRGSQCYHRRTGRCVRAVLPVHILGLACDMDRIMELARRYHLRVIEDAAEAMGVRYRGRHVGTFGDIGVFSFNGNKIITSGGGGMCVMNDPALSESARYLTTQARDDAIESIHNEVGYNYRMSSLQAALGVAQLEQLDGFIAIKRAMARAYEQSLRDLDGITLMPDPPNTQPTYWLYTILLRETATLADRQSLIGKLRAHGIQVRPLWHPIHRLAPYRDCETVAIEHSMRLYERGVSLPSSVGLTESDLQRCIAVIKQCVMSQASVTQRVGRTAQAGSVS